MHKKCRKCRKCGKYIGKGRFFTFLCLSYLAIWIFPAAAQADLKPRALSTDPRMRVVAYDPNNVVTITGSQLVQTNIQFGPDETIVGVEGGDSAAWAISINKVRQNILFVKPTIDASDTNMAVITDKNLYQFHLTTTLDDTTQEEAKNKTGDNAVTYSVRFTYPEQERLALAAQLQQKHQLQDAVVTDHSVDPLTVNWEYSFSDRCAKEFVPIKAFDDGKFTYFQFSPNTEIPAIFIVDQKGQESLANATMRGQYVVIQRIARQFSLRNGHGVSCVFNDNYAA